MRRIEPNCNLGRPKLTVRSSVGSAGLEHKTRRANQLYQIGNKFSPKRC